MPLHPEVYRKLVQAKLFIDNHFREPIDLEQISRQALLSRYHFHRLFRQVYQTTPLRYITQKRLEKARALLAENKQVTEVCNEVGFESIGSFSVLFKKEIGFAPQYYRNKAFQKKKEQEAIPQKAIPHCFIQQFKWG